MRAALQFALAARAATQTESSEIKELAQHLIQTLPAGSKYLDALLPIAAGTFKHSQVFLLF
jgi:hypothetical protein